MKLKNLINLKALKEEDFAHTPGLHQKDYSEQTPLEVQAHDDNQLYYIDTEYIEAYIHGDTVTGIDPDRGHEDKELNRDNSDATQGGLRAQGFADTSAAGLVPGDPNWPGEDDRDNFPDEEEDIDEGTCGYTQTVDGRKLKTPGGTRGPKPLQERFQQLAGIKPLYELEGSFDDRLKAAGGFGDEEFDDITSRDIGSPFPGEDTLPDFNETDVKNIEDEANVSEDNEKTEYIVEILLPVTVPHFLLGLGAQDENGREEIAKKIADFYRKNSEIHPKAYIGAVEKRNPAR